MRELNGRVAVVTGAASGIGRALAQRFAAEGMSVVLADIEEPALRQADEELAAGGASTLAVKTDVSRWEDVEALAAQAYERFGAVHVLCNNAGVAGEGGGGVGLWNRDVSDWQWVLGVNLWGVIHGVHAFVPRMAAAGEEGHVINTASIAGIMPGNNIYGVSKHAVVALTEALLAQLRAGKTKIGVSVLCPGVVDTNIYHSARNRPGRPQQPRPDAEDAAWRQRLAQGLQPAEVADAVLEAVREERFYVLPMQANWLAEFENVLRARTEEIIKSSRQVHKETAP